MPLLALPLVSKVASHFWGLPMAIKSLNEPWALADFSASDFWASGLSGVLLPPLLQAAASKRIAIAANRILFFINYFLMFLLLYYIFTEFVSTRTCRSIYY